jgi:uncharacterized membrane-anchored protein YhcB (DUF1043 family)
MVEASVTGLVRTLLIIIGVIVLLRFLGQLMNAKRNMEEERKLNAKQRHFNKEKERKSKHLGKTSILDKSQGSDNTEDVDFEEM